MASPILFQLLSFVLLLGVGVHSQSILDSCPNAESIIKQTVSDHFDQDNTILAGVLRMHFHDCFVNGCDGSLLLESNEDGSSTERLAPPNNNSLRGFEVIEDAKKKLEEACPGIVSCADILAIAARDSVVQLGMEHYDVPTGRFDGRVSSFQLAVDNLPGPNMAFQQLQKVFSNQDLSTQDLVLLSGGHTIGTSQCRFFENRIYNFQGTGSADPSLSPTYVEQLKSVCTPQGADPSPRNELDKGSQFSFDNSYYQNLIDSNGLLTSDQVLTGSDSSDLVQALAQNKDQFLRQFGESMINMGNIGWKTSANGEIRAKCSAVNPGTSAS